jgi:hypothetical protein
LVSPRILPTAAEGTYGLFKSYSITRVTRHKKIRNTRWRQQPKKVMGRRGFCWQRVMVGQKFFPNRVKVSDVMADDDGKKACYKKLMTTLSISLSLSIYLYLSIYFYFSLNFPLSNFCFSLLLFCFRPFTEL